jgi:hypothetical protein
MKKMALFLTLSTGLLTAGCSRLDLALKFVDTYVVYKVDDYFDLTSKQKDWLRVEFEKDFAKIKSNILPKAAKDLERLSITIANKKTYTEKEIEAELELLFTYFMEIVRTFTQNAKSFASLLSIKQVENFQKNYREKLEDFRESNTPKKAQDRMLTSYDNWFGSLSSAQTSMITSFITENPFPTDLLVTNRLRLSDEFKEAFAVEASRNSFIDRLFTDYNSMLDSNYTVLRSNRNKSFIRLLTSMLNSMTEDQREELATNLKNRSNQLMKIK